MSAPVRRVAISHLRPAVPSVCDSVRLLLPLPLLALAAVPTGFGQSGANSDAIYSALRNAPLGTEAVRVTDLKLKRDAGHISSSLRNGLFCRAVERQSHRQERASANRRGIQFRQIQSRGSEAHFS